jgi:hypothetical protein
MENLTVNTNTVFLLRQFANQRPGLDFNDYGQRKYYMQDYREILKDLHSFRELLNLAINRIDNLNEVLTNRLSNNGDRLTLKDGKLQYITGQYFPTEYRNAACRILSYLIWESYRDEKHENGESVYKDGHEIRKAIKRNLRTQNTKLYFC